MWVAGIRLSYIHFLLWILLHFFVVKGWGDGVGGGSEERRTSGVISIPVMLAVLVVLEQRKNENELQRSAIDTETTAAAGDQIWKEVLKQIVELVMTVFHNQCNCAFRLCVAQYPPPPAHARPCLSTGWALNRRFEEILGPLFLWSRMEDWVFVERLYRERGAQSCL